MTDRIKRGDLKPDYQVTLTDLDGAVVVDLSTATSARVILYFPDGSSASRTLTGPFNATGVLTMSWQATDTANTGDILSEVEVTWPGNKPQTFPADTYVVTRVYQDLG